MRQKHSTNQSQLRWPARPYKGLAPYLEDDSELLAGRTRDVALCSKILGDSRTSILALHGPTAAGKSSFLRAGLIPSLKGLGPKYELVEANSSTNSLLVRSTENPLAALGAGVFNFVRERQRAFRKRR